ncbi:MAG: hypothetical protein ACOYL6_18595 [Bacteriovoracaceae bacterium]
MNKMFLMLLGLTVTGQIFAYELKGNTLQNGMSIYTFDPDLGAPVPVCKGDCAEHWPPVLISTKEESELKGDLGTIKRSNGFIQLTVKGRPVYTFFADRISGDTKGDGLGNVWHLVKP